MVLTPTINDIVWVVEQDEGGFRTWNSEGDPGGMSYAGISSRYHKCWDGWYQDGHVKMESAIQLYLKEYAQKLPMEEMEDHTTLRRALLSAAILCGPKDAVRWLQAAVNGGLMVDGICGPKTRKETRYAVTGAAHELLSEICLRWMDHLLRYATSEDTAHFAAGWANRVNRYWNNDIKPAAEL